MKKKSRKMLTGILLIVMTFCFSTTVFAQDYSVQFSGKTYNGTSRVRSGSSTTSTKVGTISANTVLTFDRYTYGEGVEDVWTGKMDYRWYGIKGSNGTQWIASALVNGNAPGSSLNPPTPSSGLNQSSALNNKIAAERKKFPAGARWNNYFSIDGHAGWQCLGFALQVYADLNGTTKSKQYNTFDYDAIKVGDYMRVKSPPYDGHSFVVINKDSNGINVVDCNYKVDNIVRWDRFIDKNTLKNTFITRLSAS